MIRLTRKSDNTIVEFENIFSILANSRIDGINKSIRINDIEYHLANAVDTSKTAPQYELQKSVLATVKSPPEGALRGERYLISSEPLADNEFSEYADCIAERLVNTWEFTLPISGMSVFHDVEDNIVVYVNASLGWRAPLVKIANGSVTTEKLAGATAGSILVARAGDEPDSFVWEALASGTANQVLRIQPDGSVGWSDL